MQHVQFLGVGVFHFYAIFHSSVVGRNLELTWKFPNPKFHTVLDILFIVHCVHLDALEGNKQNISPEGKQTTRELMISFQEWKIA